MINRTFLSALIALSLTGCGGQKDAPPRQRKAEVPAAAQPQPPLANAAAQPEKQETIAFRDLGAAAQEQIRQEVHGQAMNIPRSIRCTKPGQANRFEHHCEPVGDGKVPDRIPIKRMGPFRVIELSDTIYQPGKLPAEFLTTDGRGINQTLNGFGTLEIRRDFIDVAPLAGSLRQFADLWNGRFGTMRAKRKAQLRAGHDERFDMDCRSFSGFGGLESHWSTLRITGASEEIVSAEVECDWEPLTGGSGAGDRTRKVNFLVAEMRPLRASDFFDPAKNWKAHFERIRFKGDEFGMGRKYLADPAYWSFKDGAFHFGTEGYIHGRTWNDGLCMPWAELMPWLSQRGKRIAASFPNKPCQIDENDSDPDVFDGYLSEVEVANLKRKYPGSPKH